MEFNWLGVAFVSEELPNWKEIEEMVAQKTEELRTEARAAFDKWLDEQGLELVMGVIVPEGSIK